VEQLLGRPRPKQAPRPATALALGLRAGCRGLATVSQAAEGVALGTLAVGVVAVSRWPLLLLTLALAGAAGAVIARRAVEPVRADLSPSDAFDKFLGEPVPEVMSLRILAKRHVAREAAEGARPLVQAAALFRVLNRHPPALAPPDHPSLNGPTEEERLCRQVILFVTYWQDGGREAAAAAARLEAELHEGLRRHGAVHLPDPAGLPSAEELLEEVRTTMTETERRACLFPCETLQRDEAKRSRARFYPTHFESSDCSDLLEDEVRRQGSHRCPEHANGQWSTPEG